MATQYAQLIKLEGAKDLEDEPHCCEKPHRSGHQADGDRRHPHVAVVDQKSGEARQLYARMGTGEQLGRVAPPHYAMPLHNLAHVPATVCWRTERSRCRYTSRNSLCSRKRATTKHDFLYRA